MNQHHEQPGTGATGGLPRRFRPHPRQAWGPPWLAPISHRTQIDTFWLLVSAMMLTMGVLFFGWRGMLGVSAAWLATLATYLMMAMLLQLFWPRRQQDSSLHVLTMGLLLGASLPVMREPLVPILGGVVMGALCHLIGRSHRVRIHPVAAAMVLAWVIPLAIGQWRGDAQAQRNMVSEPAVLRLDHLVVGDLFHTPSSREHVPGAWWEDASLGGYHAMLRPEPARALLRSGIPGQPDRLADLLSQSRLPRVEEMLLGCVPGPIGATSKAVIIILGVYVMHRGLAWWPMAAGGVLAAVAALMLIPVRVDGAWTVMAMLIRDMGPAMGFVYVGYVLLAGPLLWILLILAPATAPMSSRGKILYGLVVGAGAIVAMFATGIWASAYLALVLAGALARPLDALQRSPMLDMR